MNSYDVCDFQLRNRGCNLYAVNDLIGILLIKDQDVADSPSGSFCNVILDQAA